MTETRNPGSFSTIKLYDKIDMRVVKGSAVKVEVTAGRHIIKNIHTSIADNVLSIDNVNKCNFVRGYKRQVSIVVTVPHIDKVENQGVGTIVFDNDFNQDTLEVVAESSGDVYVNGIFNQLVTAAHGNGNIYLDGSVNDLYAYSNSINFLRGSNMVVSNYIFVETLSIGDCHVNATKARRLDTRIWNSGNVYYKGQPPVINNLADRPAKGKLVQE